MSGYRLWIQALSPSDECTGFVPLPFADGGEEDESAARNEARAFSRRYRLRTVVADWDGPRFYFDGGEPVDMVEGMAWFVPPQKPTSAPDRPKFTSDVALKVYLELTLDERRYRESLRRLDKGTKCLATYARALHRNRYKPGTWLHAHHEEFNRLPAGVDWDDVAVQLRALYIHSDLGAYDATLPRRTPEERVQLARRFREVMPDYELRYHLRY